MRKAILAGTIAIFGITAQLQAADGDEWKDKYFKMHPDAAADKDGTLSWPEYKAHKKALDSKKVDGEDQKSSNTWKDEFFKKHPEADTDKDGTLSWPEYKLYKNKLDKK